MSDMLGSNILGFDIGGTYIKYGVVDGQGEMSFEDKMQTPKPDDQQGEKILALLLSKADELIQLHDVVAIGISSHGVVDNEKGIVTCSSYHLPGLKDLPIVEKLTEKFSLPVIIDNDAKAAAIGEYWHGSAQKFKSFVFLALGTSIGGAIVIDGKLLRGLDNCAGEVGYLITNERDLDKPFIPGAWEAYGSASSLIKRYKVVKGAELTSDDFNRDLAAKDSDTLRVLEDYVYSLTSGLISLAHTLAPEAFILGGGITKMGQALLDPVKKKYQERALDPVKNIKISMATLGNHAGMVGAAYLAKQKIS